MVSWVADEKPQLLPKKAGCNSHGQDSSYFLGWQEYEKNHFDPATNPGGIIQMGLAENQLSFSTRTIWMMPPGLAAGSKGFFSYSCHPRK